jgi:tRNA-specific 2-thiouridylase
LGERHGFTITKKSPTDGPYYVVSKDVAKNTLIVSQNKVAMNGEKKNTNTKIKLENTNWISKVPEVDKKYTAQVRYHGECLPCKIICVGQTSAEVVFEMSVLVASGQSCVIYDKDICIGGGVVV